ncbi:MAG: PD-(D/E)XK nuclease-like domain-containing protein [Candidatus Heimdallarchaeaceae archaeon]|jgi:hypothetical protein|tara:strand:+ start:350 stop:1093 length:744 start_codon:yes stop_codon:yes gene_type:complete
MFSKQETLYKLQEDKEYYGDFGKQFLSNSDIYSLLNDPRSFRKTKGETKAMVEGRYFHVSMIEPHKKDEFVIIDSTSRNTKNYKNQIQEHGLSIALLKSEAEHIDSLVSVMKSNFNFYEFIYSKFNMYEVPGIKTIKGAKWKGKADILASDYIIDLKTTSDISKFKYSAKKYNYDSQSYIYQQIFGVPVVFYVIDKNTKMLGVYEPTDSFIQSGEEKVERALEIYNKFFSKDATENIDEFFIKEELT